MTPALATSGPTAFWYLTRATGAVALLLLTLSMLLGVANWRRWRPAGQPRFVLDALHRNVSLMVLVFLGLHVLTSILDGFAPVGFVDAVVPLHSSYRPLWLGFGALSFDLLLAVTITSLLRQRLGHRAWQITHWLAYAAWPVALLHTVGTGSDVRRGWLLALCAICLAAILVAICFRTAQGWPSIASSRFAALAGAGMAAIALIAWLPSGPLAKGWARRAGTPAHLLAVTTTGGAAAASPGRASSRQSPSLDAPFHARLSGVLHQSQSSATGLVTLDMPLRLSGSGSRRLDVRIDGEPAEGGGVSMTDGRILLGTANDPSRFSGQVTSLDGTTISALVSRAHSQQLALDIELRIDSGSGAVGGTVSAQSAGPAR
jgi:ferric reductase like protein